jgi:chaperonin GroES
MKLQPLGDRVVVKAKEENDARTPSGLVIPDTAKEKPQFGEVLAVGPGALNEDGDRLPMDVSKGDVVVYSKFGGTEVKVDGQEYLILSSRDLLAIVG